MKLTIKIRKRITLVLVIVCIAWLTVGFVERKRDNSLLLVSIFSLLGASQSFELEDFEVSAKSFFYWLMGDEWRVSRRLHVYFKDSKVRSLALAAYRGDVEEVNALARDGVNINAVGRDGVTPLFILAKDRYTDWFGFEAMLKNGANPNIVVTGGRYKGESVTFFLAEAFRTKLLRMVLVYGGDPNIKGPQLGSIVPVIRVGSLAIAKILVEAGADVNATDSHGVTLLQDILGTGNAKWVYYLLVHGAKVGEKVLSEKRGIIEQQLCVGVGVPTVYNYFFNAVRLLENRGLKFKRVHCKQDEY